MKDFEVADLRSMLTDSASRPRAEVTVALNQGVRAEIAALEAEMSRVAEDAPSQRMGAASPLKEIAKRIEAARARMSESEVTFKFEALTYEQREQIRLDMRGRDDQDELNLRAIAAMCVEPAGVTHGDMRQLRDRLGVNVFENTVDAAASRAGGGDWSVPFSFAASQILSTGT